MRVLVASDKFKDCLSATEACEIIATTILQHDPSARADVCPITDGGDGFTDVLTGAARGEIQPCEVRGPRATRVTGRVGMVRAAEVPADIRAGLAVRETDRIGVMAMSDASGLALLAPTDRDPWQTHTAGTGDLLRFAAAQGAAAIVLGIGGSATNDLGVGALTALGLELRDQRGTPISPEPVNWHRIVRLAAAVASLPPIFIACDVTNPLLGPNGAAAVYGPQKGLRPGEVAKFDHASARMALLLCNHFGQPDTLMEEPGAGAAGGLGFGLRVAAKAQLVSGFDFVARWLDLDTRIAAADVVITGEGRFDETSLSGKGPAGVVARAVAAGKAAHVFAGEVTSVGAAAGKFSAHAVTPAGAPLDRALREARANLATAVARTFAR